MRAEVPDDADVGLVQSEVDAARRDEVELAELAARRSARWIDDDRRAVEERVARHQHEPASAREPRSARAASSDDAGERLLDEHVLAGLRARAAASSKCVETGVAIATASTSASASTSSSCVVRGPPGSGARSRRAGSLRAGRRSTTTSALVELGEVADEIRAPVAETDDGDAHGTVPARVTASPFAAGGAAAASCRRSARSSPSDQLARVSTSISSASPKVERARAVTCQRPVMPAGTRSARSGEARSAPSRTGCRAAGRRATCRRAGRSAAAAARRGSSCGASGRSGVTASVRSSL